MSCCIETISRHVSIRKYTDEPVKPEDLEAIVEAARRAPTSWGIQPFTVTIVTDGELKAKLAEAVGGQEHVAKAPVFLVFSVDYRKLAEAARIHGVEFAEPGLGHLLIGVVDAGIAAGWAALAAESLGYGIVFIALYSNPCRIAEILNLPEQVLPVVGLCVGRPAEKPSPKPRQPREVFAAENRYIALDEEAARKVAYVFGEKTQRIYSYVLSKGGYYEQVTRRLLECARRRGFRI
ncbi:nitroreductase family protein [Hyperthermus butylicus]|uniref:Nitroreductase n=1 Tax=Hyperthermus butylicus (strain DSM 5456 / JCM 9403 / PLM1-5) TaxID=415426 RepID=A2BLK1_HYPBU|nr:nitroreductase family protein [Hyperthermus butylicus]ABM80862.1 putative Nitroreductase [Hyperthermus butylicus DSM 5456]